MAHLSSLALCILVAVSAPAGADPATAIAVDDTLSLNGSSILL